MFFKEKYIILKKELNLIDKFVISFVKLLKKFTDYVIVSGYVSILLGRNRGTDDIDIIIPTIEKEVFKEFYIVLKKERYWVLNSEDFDDIYDLIKSGHGIRIAENKNISPNIELKFAKGEFDNISLREKIKARINNFELNISNLELQIAYKEEVLKSNKDIEDARHLREINKNLNLDLIENYKKRLKNES